MILEMALLLRRVRAMIPSVIGVTQTGNMSWLDKNILYLGRSVENMIYHLLIEVFVFIYNINYGGGVGTCNL